MATAAFMLPAGGTGHCLALWHTPSQAAADWRGVVLYLHPYAEEMNKTRRMAALQSRALAAAGFAVLQIDLKGCGDSSGDFADATWADWIANIDSARQWLRQRSAAPLTLWGLRAGCLLAASAAAQWPAERCDFVFWQPAASGAAVLRQFMRQAAAAAMLDGGAKGVLDGLRQQLDAGRSITVSGYTLNPALAAGLEQARLTPPAQVGRVGWFEVASAPAATAAAAPAEPGISPAGVTAGAPWRAAAAAFHAQAVIGPPFWHTAEIETAPALITATRDWMAAA